VVIGIGIGIVIGIVAGGALGLAWHFMRQAEVRASGRVAEDRLADAQRALVELTSQLQGATVAAAAVETARAVLATELSVHKKSDEE